MKKIIRLNLVLGFGLISSITFGQQPKKQVEPTQEVQKESKVEEMKIKEVRSEKKIEESKSPQESTNQEKAPVTPVKTMPAPTKAEIIQKPKTVNSSKEEKLKPTPPRVPSKPVAPKK